MKKTWLFGLFLVFAAGMLFAGPGGEKKKGFTIHYLTARAESEATVQAVKDVATEWKQTHPDFNFEIESIAARASYLQKLRILAASNELPDWFDADPEDFFASLVDAGKVYPIESLFNELGVSNRFYTIPKDYLRLPRTGNLSLIPLQCNSEYFFYNKDMFRSAGITKVPETFNELLATCEALQKAGFTPISTSTLEWPSLRLFAMIPFKQTGNEYIMNAVQGKASWGDGPGIAAAEFMQKIAKYFQVGYSTADYTTVVDLFVGKQAAIMYNGTWVIPEMVDGSGNLPPHFGFFQIPKYANNDRMPLTDHFANSGIGIAIAKEKMTAEMKEFLAFMFDRYPDVAIEKYNLLPALAPSAKANIPPLYRDILDDIGKVKEYAVCWDVVIDQASLETLNKANSELCLGLITPRQFISTMDAIIAENVKK